MDVKVYEWMMPTRQNMKYSRQTYKSINNNNIPHQINQQNITIANIIYYSDIQHYIKLENTNTLKKQQQDNQWVNTKQKPDTIPDFWYKCFNREN